MDILTYTHIKNKKSGSSGLDLSSQGLGGGGREVEAGVSMGSSRSSLFI